MSKSGNNIIANADTLQVTMAAVTDLSDMLKPVPGRRQPMKGFDEEFVDIVDYIVRITHRIWDERQVETCRQYYAEDCAIQTLAGTIAGGVETVINNTWKTLEGWPDRTLDTDNVVWSGNEDDGYYSSHLITSHMTNLGPTEYGPPTGKMARIQTVADCLCKENKIIEEWLMRDNLGLVTQMGLDGLRIAKAQAAGDHNSNNGPRDMHLAEHVRTLSQAARPHSKPDSPEAEAEAFTHSLFAALWNAGELEKTGDYYDYRADIHAPAARSLYGAKQAAGFIESFRAIMPDLVVSVDHVADIPYLGGARDVAVRWSLAGTHSGEGQYGPPSGGPIYILASSHFRIMNGRIRSEWTVFDELAVLRQVERNRLILGT